MKVHPAGSVHAQFVRCGKPNCRCAEANGGHLHGPYYYRCHREGGRFQRQYVARSDAAQVQALCAREHDQRQRERQEYQESRRALACMAQNLRDLKGEPDGR